MSEPSEQTDAAPPRPAPSRRTVLAGAAGTAMATSLAVAGLAGCAGDGGDGGSAGPGGSSASPRSTSSLRAGAGPLATTADIPVGTGRVFPAARVVVVRTADDEFLAYSATCTHQACAITVLSAQKLRCPCHGSTFDTADGAVLSGPAPRPLPRREIVVEGDEIRLA
jgi:Rieske Fe-S protein